MNEFMDPDLRENKRKEHIRDRLTCETIENTNGVSITESKTGSHLKALKY